MPYLAEYLLSREGHGSWRELQAMPAAVLRYWLLYRNARLAVEAAARG